VRLLGGKTHHLKLQNAANFHDAVRYRARNQRGFQIDLMACVIHVVCRMEHDAVERVSSSASINDQDQVGLYKGKTIDSRLGVLVHPRGNRGSSGYHSQPPHVKVSRRIGTSDEPHVTTRSHTRAEPHEAHLCEKTTALQSKQPHKCTLS
jgi:hypothetical protein